MLKNLVYFGSPAFSAEILASLLESKQVNIVGVVTTPDKPTGRKQSLTSSPVALLAEKYDLPTYKPNKLDEANLAHLRLLKPDIFLVVSYGKIIPQTWLDTPTIGTFNVHFSLLPKYRGALCISEAIKNMDTETGVTLMEMDASLDHGPIIAQEKVTIDINDNVADLTTKLTQLAEGILARNLPEICAQKYSKIAQDESQATFTPSHKTLTHQAAFIPWSDLSQCLDNSSSLRVSYPSQSNLTSQKLHALIRSLNPEPGAWTKISTLGAEALAELKILKTSLIGDKLVIDTVQMPGKNPISWKQFLSGHQI